MILHESDQKYRQNRCNSGFKSGSRTLYNQFSNRINSFREVFSGFVDRGDKTRVCDFYDENRVLFFCVYFIKRAITFSLLTSTTATTGLLASLGSPKWTIFRSFKAWICRLFPFKFPLPHALISSSCLWDILTVSAKTVHVTTSLQVGMTVR